MFEALTPTRSSSRTTPEPTYGAQQLHALNAEAAQLVEEAPTMAQRPSSFWKGGRRHNEKLRFIKHC